MQINAKETRPAIRKADNSDFLVASQSTQRQGVSQKTCEVSIRRAKMRWVYGQHSLMLHRYWKGRAIQRSGKQPSAGGGNQVQIRNKASKRGRVTVFLYMLR
jgi:hypothetical protein